MNMLAQPKILFVRDAFQVALLKEIIIPEMNTGFWAEHRPAGHGQVWLDVEIKATENGQLGPVGFLSPRNYNMNHPDFVAARSEDMVALGKTFDEKMEYNKVRHILTELGQIIGSRLTDVDEEPEKANRGTNREDTRELILCIDSGKGLGSPDWADHVDTFMNQLTKAGVSCDVNRTNIILTRASREARMYITGDNRIAVEYIGVVGGEYGGTLGVCGIGEDLKRFMDTVRLEMVSVNQRKQGGEVVSRGDTGTVVRRAPVSRRIFVTAEALQAANPFNLVPKQD